MKTVDYLRSSLLFPYLLWFVAALILAFENDRSSIFATGHANETIITIAIFYTFGIVIWIFPYSILAGILWFWSFDQSTNRIVKVFVLSPLMMTVLVAIEILLFSISTNDGVSISDLFETVVAVGLFSIPFGYSIIAIVVVIHKLLQVAKLIQPENEIPPTQSP